MCLIVFAWRPGHPLPLIVASNRDEFYARPTLPLGHWEDYPAILAGRDLQAGGTWMGLRSNGRFAALTNIRAPGRPLGRYSRGILPERYLQGTQAPEEYLANVAAEIEGYSGFNLLVGDEHELWYLNSDEAEPRALSAGVYGLSNAALDTPWPKLLKACNALNACLDDPQPEHLLKLLADTAQATDEDLPSTGVALGIERRLSSIFIKSPDYGTRASTALIRQADGTTLVCERSFGSEGLLGEKRFRLNPELTVVIVIRRARQASRPGSNAEAASPLTP